MLIYSSFREGRSIEEALNRGGGDQSRGRAQQRGELDRGGAYITNQLLGVWLIGIGQSIDGGCSFDAIR